MTHGLRLGVFMVVALLVSADVAWAQDSPPAGTPGGGPAVEEAGNGEACSELPWAVGRVCDGIADALAVGVQPIIAGGARAVLDEMVAFVVDGAGWLLGQVVAFLDTSTRPQLTSDWFERAYQDMTVVAVLGLLPFLLLAIIQGIVRQDVPMLLRATFAYVPLAGIGTAAAVVVMDLLVQLTDLLSAWVGRSLGRDLDAFTTGLGEALASLPAGAGGPVAGLAALFAAGVVAFAAFVIWLELLLRQAAIYVAVLFLPLGFMAMVWPATAHWLRRLVQGLVAIILSKFVIVAVMALAASALAAQAPEGGFAVVVAGASLLSLAALAPYVLLRLIPVFESGLSGDLEGTYRRPTAAVAPPATVSHPLQAVRQRATDGDLNGSRAGMPAAGAASRDAAAGGPGPSGTSGSASPAGAAGRTPAGAGAAGRAPAASGSAPAAGGAASSGGGAAASGVAAGAGAAAVGVGTVAAGTGAAKGAGQQLQARGAEQHAATSGSDRAGPAPAPPRRSPPPGPEPSPPPRRSGGAAPSTGDTRKRPPRQETS